MADAARKAKGRGHNGRQGDDNFGGRGGIFERIECSDGSEVAKSVEGWIIFVTGVHMEAQEDDIIDAFGEFGVVKNINVNLDRRTGFVKGYALVEYENKEEAEEAINEMNGSELLGQTISVDWAFSNPSAGTNEM